MLFNWKLKIVSSIVAVAMLFTMCPSTTFAAKTYLHMRLENKNFAPSVEEVKDIVSKNPEYLNEKDDDGHTPLDIAKANGLSEIVSFLSKSASSGDDQLSDFFTSFTHVPGKIATLEAQTEKLTIQMTEVTKEAAKTAPQVVESSKKIATLEAQIAELKQKQLATVEKRSKEAEEKAKKAEEKAAETAKSVPQVVGTALKPQIEELKRNQQGLEKIAKDAAEKAKKAEEKAAETVKAVPQVVESSKKIAALEAQIAELKQNQLATVEKRSKEAEEKAKKAEEKAAETAKSMPTVVESSKKIAAIEAQNEELKKQIKSSQAEIADLRSLLTAVAKTMPQEVEKGKKISALETQNEELKRQIKSLQTETTALRSQLAAVPKAATILSSAYPVGSIYISIDSTDPSTLFGGTWERIKDTFLLAAGDIYSAGTAGGEAEHTLTINEMPSHNHGFKSGRWFWGETAGGGDIINSQSETSYVFKRGTDNTGGSQAHNNMPPYITCYMWKRTA